MQAAILTGANVITRALGFVLRIVLSRLMGAQAMGVMELAHSAHMLSVTPVTAGLPLCISRLTARDKDDTALRAGKSLVLRVCAVLTPAWLLCLPWLAHFLRDVRVLPSLVIFTPCITVLGLSAVYSGYCYGCGHALAPALSEMAEQAVRFVLASALLMHGQGLTVSRRAALPAAATGAAEAAGLLLMVYLLPAAQKSGRPIAPVRREIWRLSLPLIASRLLTVLLRTASGALIPVRLAASGMTSEAAMEAFGMLQGMVMPVLFLPGIVTGALGTVGTPAVAARQGGARRHTAALLLFSALACGSAGGLIVYVGAPFIARCLYALPALTPIFRAAAPLTLLFALQHAVNGILSGLGQQKRLMLPALCSALISLLCMYVWASQPHLRLLGAVRAMITGQAAGLLWGLRQAWRSLR